MISVSEAGTAAANGALPPAQEALSADGRYLVFMSSSSDVVSGDMNGTTDVFVRDLQTGATTLVSRTASGGTANGCSDAAVVSADGGFVAFQSTATDLDVTGTSGTSGWRQIYLWDRSTGGIRLISFNHTGTDGGDNHSSNPTISEDGQRIAFETCATDLVAGIVDANGVGDIYLRDFSGESPTTVLVSHVASDAATTGDFASQAPRISRDSSRVVYLTAATNLEEGVSDINSMGLDVVVYCVNDGSNQYVSVETQDATSGNGESTRTSHSLSADGRFEVFTSRSSDLVPGDLNGLPDVFLCDLLTGAMTLVSHTASGSAADNISRSAVISADGNFVVFESLASNLDVTGPISSFGGLYRWARETGEIVLVSVNAAGTDGVNQFWQHASISADGQRIAYESGPFATDLVAGVTDTNNTIDVYLRDFTGASPTTVLVSHAASGLATTGNLGSSMPQISRDGSCIVYLSSAADLETGVTDLNGQGSDVVVFDVSSGSNHYVSVETGDATSGNDGSNRTRHSLSADGRYEVFTSSASDLVSGDLNDATDVYLRDLQTGMTTLISHLASDGSPNDRSSAAVISADGNFVAFESFATDMAVTGARITGYANRLYRWNRLTDEILLVSSNASSTYDGYDGSYEPSISADGQRIAFQIGDEWSGGLIYLRDFAGSSPTTVLVSHAAGDPDTPTNAPCEMAQIASDGTTVVFLSTADNLVSGVMDGNGPGEDLFAYNVASGEIVAVNVVPGGAATGNGGVDPRFDISHDGQTIAFSSDASNLTPSDSDHDYDVFVRNLSIPAVDLVSIGSSGHTAGQGPSWSPSISGDGQYVAFESEARLASVDTNWYSDIYVRDRNPAGPMTALISVNSSGTAAGAGNSYEPCLTDDGMMVGFWGYAGDLDGGNTDANGKADVFMRNWKAAAPTTRLVSRAGEENVSGNHSSSQVELSGDGSRLVFTSQATNLTSGISDVNGYATDVFVFDGSNMALASQKGAGTFTCTRGASDLFDLSDTGQYVVFSANAPGLVSGNGSWYEQVYVRDVVAGANELVSVNDLGIMGDGWSHAPSISGDGRYIAFESTARNLSPLDARGVNDDIYVRDRDPGHPTTTLISVNSLGTSAGSYGSIEPDISHDGTTVAFRSGSSDLDGEIADTNGTYDVFVRNWQTPTPTTRLVSRSGGGSTSGDSVSSQAEVSDDGRRLVFTSMAWDLEAGVADVNGWNRSDVFAFDGSSVRFVSRKGAGNFTGSAQVWGFDLSDTGQFVAFSTTAVGTLADAFGGVFVRDVVADTTERVSVDNAGVAGGGESPSISGDGRYVAFEGSNLDPRAGFAKNIYVRDRNPSSPTTTLISIDYLGTGAGDNYSFLPRISHDGSTVVFGSYASNLDGAIADTNGQPDVFLRKWRAATPVTDLVSRHCDGLTSGSGVPVTPAISDDGITIAFASYAPGLTQLPDINNTSDVFAVKAAAFFIAPLDAAKSEGNSGTTGFTFLVSRRWFSDNAVTIDWVVTGSDAAPADAADFGGAFPRGSVDFIAGETEKTITVNVTSDLIAEVNEGFAVSLSNSSSNSQIVAPTARGTILNDDAPEIVVTDSPDPVVRPNTLILTANEVSDSPNGLAAVAFYRESNGTAGLQVGSGGDTLVGTDSDKAGGWSVVVATNGLSAGAYMYYAQATDDNGIKSADGASSPSTTNTVENVPPTISNITDQSTNEDITTPAIAFTIGDEASSPGSLTVSGVSSNAMLVPAANIVYAGSGANRTVTLTPAANQFGTTTITVTVTDADGGTASDNFVLTVNSANDLPTISDITEQSTSEDAATAAIPFTVDDVETAAGSLTVSGVSSNATLVPAANIVFAGSGANRTVTLTPAANQFGTTTITVTVTDADGGTASDSFVLTVNSANDLPTISDITEQSTSEDAATAAIPFTVDDVETAAGSLTVSGVSSNATLVPAANIVFAGGGANRTVTLTPAANQFGTTTITVTVTDADGGTASDSFVLTVDAVNDHPVANVDAYSVQDNGMLTVSALGVLSNDTDADGEVLHAQPQISTSYGKLQLNSNGSFSYEPNKDFNREDSFIYQASDGLSTSDPVTVTITVLTAYPWHNGIAPLNVNDDKFVTPLDALLVINELNKGGSRKLPLDRPRPLSVPFLDVTRDGFVTPLDALLVINYLNTRGQGEGEGARERDIVLSDSSSVAEVSVSIRAASQDRHVGRLGGNQPVHVPSESPDSIHSLDILFARLDVAHSALNTERTSQCRKTSSADLEAFLATMLGNEPHE